jgi:hypothetical protein
MAIMGRFLQELFATLPKRRVAAKAEACAIATPTHRAG